MVDTVVTNKEWESDDKEVKVHTSCPHIVRDIYVKRYVFDCVEWGCNKFDDVEFFVYLVGKVKSSCIIVEDVIVPEQEVAYAAAEVTKTIRNEQIIGTLHKHPGNSNCASDTDHKYMNYPLMIVVNADGTEWKAHCKQKSVCGCWLESSPDVTVVQDNTMKKIFKQKFKGKVKRKQYGGYVVGGEHQYQFGDGFRGEEAYYKHWAEQQKKAATIATNKSCPHVDKADYENCTFKSYKACDCVNAHCVYKDTGYYASENWQKDWYGGCD
jgi:proteasome lid subunit RPN8/RPN11